MRRSLIALSAALLAAGPAAAYDYSPEALRVLNAARAATGGEGWNKIRGWNETGAVNGARYTLQADPVRYGVRLELQEAAGRRIHGYNGAGDWEIAPTGGVTGVEDRATLAQARTVAFFTGYGYFFIHRFAAKGTHQGVRQFEGRSFDVLQVRPADGLGRELWFDRRTRLLARVVDRNGPVPVTMELADYRKVGPVQAPFRITVDEGDPARRRVRVVEKVTFEAADRAVFSLPPAK